MKLWQLGISPGNDTLSRAQHREKRGAYLGVWQHFCFGCFKASAAFALGVLPRLPPINHVILFHFSLPLLLLTTSTTEDKSKLAFPLLLHSLYIYQFRTSNSTIKAFLRPDLYCSITESLDSKAFVFISTKTTTNSSLEQTSLSINL